MKKWIVIIGTTAIAMWLIADTVREFFANETIQYFTSKPVTVLYAIGMGVAGGLAVFAFERVSPHCQPQVRILALGTAASAATVFAAWFGYSVARLISFAAQSEGILSESILWASATFLFFSVIAGFLWFVFYQARRTAISS